MTKRIIGIIPGGIVVWAEESLIDAYGIHRLREELVLPHFSPERFAERAASQVRVPSEHSQATMPGDE